MTGAGISLLGVLLCALILVVTLRPQRQEIALCLSLAAGIPVLFRLVEMLTPLLETVQKIASVGGVSSSTVGTVLKGVGICMLTELTASSCRDAGESALGVKATMVGQAMLLLVSLPLFEELLQTVVSLVQG